MLELILGGARSGKSRYAEQRALDCGKSVVYIATARAGDEEMRSRIEQHRQRRPTDWQVIEEPIHLSAVLQAHVDSERCVIVDCLTLWLSNLLLDEAPNRLSQERDELLSTIDRLPGDIILVSNETGLGVVPMGQLTRRFVDEAGWLHQALAEKSQRVVFMVAGLPMMLKDETR